MRLTVNRSATSYAGLPFPGEALFPCRRIDSESRPRSGWPRAPEALPKPGFQVPDLHNADVLLDCGLRMRLIQSERISDKIEGKNEHASENPRYYPG